VYGIEAYEQLDNPGLFVYDSFIITDFRKGFNIPLKGNISYFSRPSQSFNLANQCDRSVHHAVKQTTLKENEMDSHEIITNERDTFVTEWTIPQYDSATNELAWRYYFKLTIFSLDLEGKRVRIIIEYNTDELCEKRNGLGECLSPFFYEGKLDWTGDLIGNKVNGC
jgi:hypothetical protein